MKKRAWYYGRKKCVLVARSCCEEEVNLRFLTSRWSSKETHLFPSLDNHLCLVLFVAVVIRPFLLHDPTDSLHSDSRASAVLSEIFLFLSSASSSFPLSFLFFPFLLSLRLSSRWSTRFSSPKVESLVVWQSRRSIRGSCSSCPSRTARIRRRLCTASSRRERRFLGRRTEKDWTREIWWSFSDLRSIVPVHASDRACQQIPWRTGKDSEMGLTRYEERQLNWEPCRFR